MGCCECGARSPSGSRYPRSATDSHAHSPPASTVHFDHDASALSAYKMCSGLERTATTDGGRMYARILGYLILHAPSAIARAKIVHVVHSYAQDEQTLSVLGEYFRL